MKARVEIFLKPGVLDVQGKAIETALHGIGFSQATDVRVGRIITFSLPGTDAATVEAEVKSMADKLLANQVIERYAVEVQP